MINSIHLIDKIPEFREPRFWRASQAQQIEIDDEILFTVEEKIDVDNFSELSFDYNMEEVGKLLMEYNDKLMLGIDDINDCKCRLDDYSIIFPDRFYYRNKNNDDIIFPYNEEFAIFYPDEYIKAVKKVIIEYHYSILNFLDNDFLEYGIYCLTNTEEEDKIKYNIAVHGMKYIKNNYPEVFKNTIDRFTSVYATKMIDGIINKLAYRMEALEFCFYKNRGVIKKLKDLKNDYLL